MFRLCLALGWPHPDFLGEYLSLEQVHDWMEFYGREPWGFEADDYLAAMQAFTVARSAGSKTARIEDFRLGPKLAKAANAGKPEDPQVLKERIRTAFGLHRPKK